MEPQVVYGIAAGVTVFVVTVATVGVLFVAGGSLERLRAEAKDPGMVARRATKPKLTDELLTTAAALSDTPTCFDTPHVVVAKSATKTRGSIAQIRLRTATDADLADLQSACDGSEKWGHAAYKPEEVWFGGCSASDTTVAVLDGSDVIGAIGLSHHRPRHLAVALDFNWLHPAYMSGNVPQLALIGALDALFAANYRRVEVTVDAEDADRRALFKSLGFQLEGILRKHMINDERSSDTALYSVLNIDWKYSTLPHRLKAKFKVKASYSLS